MPDSDAAVAEPVRERVDGAGTPHALVGIPPAPAWVRFVGPAARILDLHDSQRGLGAEQSQPLGEDRPGTSRGTYPAIGWALLEHLRDAEAEGSFDYVDIVPFALSLTARFGVTVEDVVYVAQTLATPTHLHHGPCLDPAGPSAQPGGSTRSTALLRKLRRGQAYMLDRSGREALAYAAGYFKWVHAGAEARKIVLDLQNADVDSFREMARRLIVRIRQEQFDLRKMLEQPEVEELRRAFLAASKRFLATIVEVNLTVSEAQSLIRTPTVAADLRAHAERSGLDHTILVDEISDTMVQVAHANASLHRLVSHFISQVQVRERALVGVVRFGAAAASFARAAPSAATDPAFLEDVFGRIGPLLPARVEFHPPALRGTILRQAPAAPKARERHRRVEAPPRVDRVDAFVRRNAALILRELAKGPLSLGAFLRMDERENDPLDVDDLRDLVEATTVFTAPYVIGLVDMPDRGVRFRVGPARTWRLKKGWLLRGPDLVMELIERLPAARRG